MTPDDESLELLELADWRRRVAVLYADVRRLAVIDTRSALALWRSERERLFRDHPQSPVPVGGRVTFKARHFEHDPEMRFEVVLERAPPPAPNALALELPNSGADRLAFRRIGRVTVPFPAGDRTLSVFWMEGYAGGLFLPFRDATNGTETYGAGRYLIDAAKSADLGGDADRGTLVLDFNFAYQPSCAFDPKWACPLAPPENRLDIPIRAGERIA
ncbi:MAG TPA: DUF1684 domain-containing protein [Candidatus Limnocylindrales bacterium]|nr:DUF1684 domain-containing protein [Candidatus Limnocylindrales bacterium]